MYINEAGDGYVSSFPCFLYDYLHITLTHKANAIHRTEIIVHFSICFVNPYFGVHCYSLLLIVTIYYYSWLVSGIVWWVRPHTMPEIICI